MPHRIHDALSCPGRIEPDRAVSTRLPVRSHLGRLSAGLALGGALGVGLGPAPAAAADPPKLKVNVRYVLVADDDGKRAGSLPKAAAVADIAAANQIFARDGGRIELVLNEASDFVQPVRSTVMNDDCTIVPGHTAASIAKVVVEDVDGNGIVAMDDVRTMCDERDNHAARTEHALQYPHDLVVFVRRGHTIRWKALPPPAKPTTHSVAVGGGKRIQWQDPVALSHWSIIPVDGAFSGPELPYVVMFSGPYSPPGRLLAHELGHYFHLHHTFGWRPATKDEARERLEIFAAANPTLEPTLVFDGDGLSDTAPDPSGALVQTVLGHGCALGEIAVPYTNAQGQQAVAILDPPRDNAMSYFHKCPTIDQRFSKQQHDIMNASLLEGNRKVLLTRTRRVCKDAKVDVVPDPTARLHARVRSVVDCMALTKLPLPWEPLTRAVERRTRPHDADARVVERLLAAQWEE